ncbi:MAG TPA: DoxX family membrane protein [Pseudonocardiaceae bacterium]|nr:DoxX family membrane protein [Pseudonocardiaceae bacterium]
MTTAQPLDGPAGTTGPDAAPAATARAGLLELATRTLNGVAGRSARFGPTVMRCALGLVYIWFGALKLAGRSEVFNLIAVTVPFADPHVFVPILGVIEVLLGIGLVSGRLPRLVLLGIIAHLVGTFLTFVTAPSWMWRGDNPLLLTTDGEFVLKNLVLISAALVLFGVTTQITGNPAEGQVVSRPRTG